MDATESKEGGAAKLEATAPRRPRPARIALLLSDVDGTLVTKGKVLTEASRRAVAALRAAGLRFAVTSSRPPAGLRMIVEPLGIDTPVAAFNAGIEKGNPTTLKEAWQRFYFRGELPEDTGPAPKDHVNKRRMKRTRIGR